MPPGLMEAGFMTPYERVKAWREANPEKHKANARRLAKIAYERDPDRFRQRSRDQRAARTEDEKAKVAENNAAYYRNLDVAKHMFYNARVRAKKYGVPFTIKLSDISVPEVCPVLGLPFYTRADYGQIGKGSSLRSATLDRIVPELGYVPGNIMVVCNLVNLLKRDFTTPDTLRAVADYIERETARVRKILGY